MSGPYADERLGDEEDDGTMPGSLEALRAAVVGHRIVSAERRAMREPEGHWGWSGTNPLVITLDNGQQVVLGETSDCCAYTEVEEFLLNVDKVDHVITGVGTTDGYTLWHIYADFGDVMELRVGWSCGNPFYYGYGFDIVVVDIPEEVDQ